MITRAMRRRFRKMVSSRCGTCLTVSTLAVLGAMGGSGWLSSPVLGQEVAVQGEAQKAPDFTFDGISFNTTAVEFRNSRRPRWVGPETDAKTGIMQYSTYTRAAHEVIIEFHNNDLYHMRIIYNAADMKRIGGWPVLHARLIQKYGDPTEGNVHQECGQGTWRISNTYIHADGTRSDGIVVLDVADVARTVCTIEAQKAGSNTGF